MIQFYLIGDYYKNKAGIYCFVNTVNNKRYIGCAKDLYIILIEHLSIKKSDIAYTKCYNKIWLR